MNKFFYLYGRSLVAHKGKVLLSILLLSLLSTVGIILRVQQEIPVDFTPQAIFMDNSPELLRLREIEKTFGREDNDWIIIVEGDLNSPSTKNKSLARNAIRRYLYQSLLLPSGGCISLMSYF